MRPSISKASINPRSSSGRSSRTSLSVFGASPPPSRKLMRRRAPILGRDENSQEFMLGVRTDGRGKFKSIKFSSRFRATILTELHRLRRGRIGVAEFPVLHLKRRTSEWVTFDSTPSPSVEDDIISESSVADLPRCLSKVPASSSMSQILTVGQLPESALEVAGQVAGSSISTTPLPYSAMAGQCEALGMVTRKKLSTWLGDPKADKLLLTFSADGQSVIKKMNYDEPRKDGVFPTESWMALRLPPASPFDNFLKAASC